MRFGVVDARRKNGTHPTIRPSPPSSATAAALSGSRRARSCFRLCGWKLSAPRIATVLQLSIDPLAERERCEPPAASEVV